VGVVRIRQQPVCSACNLMRGTLSLYSKHILENNHRENVKKLCDENRFVPSVYDQAIHLAFHNNVNIHIFHVSSIRDVSDRVAITMKDKSCKRYTTLDDRQMLTRYIRL
jgi:hypothetical protein